VEQVSIGEFSRRTRLSIKALRLYDVSGSMQQTRVEPASGIRLDRLVASPWSDAGDPVDSDVGDVAGLGCARWWELDVRPKVGMSESLKKSGGSSFRDTGCAVDDQVLNESALIVPVRLERQDHPRVVTDVADLPSFGEVPGHDLVPIQADPDDRHLGTAIGFQRDEVRER
jgi:hypothetical protein